MSFDKTAVTPTVTTNGAHHPAGPVPAAAYRNKTWREAEGQKETAVRLDYLPAPLAFPETFPEPISYDPARKLLKYRGLMFSGSYTYLRKLSTDPAYLAALDQLFIGTSCPASGAGRWLLVVAGVIVVALGVFGAVWFLR